MTIKIENKKNSIFRNEIFKTVLISFITVIITQFLTYFFWTKQFDNTKKQKLLEYKLSTFDRFTSISFKNLYYSEFDLRQRFEFHVEEQMFIDSIFYKTGVQLSDLNANQHYYIQNRMKEKNPIIYENYMKALEFQNEYNAVASIIHFQYEPSILEEKNNFTNSFSPNVLTSIIKAELDAKKSKIFDLNRDSIIGSILQSRYEHLTTLLNHMATEIKDK